jgi:hypothetical protein
MSAAEKLDTNKHNQTFPDILNFFMCGCTPVKKPPMSASAVRNPKLKKKKKKKKTERAADKEGEYHSANIKLNCETFKNP